MKTRNDKVRANMEGSFRSLLHSRSFQKAQVAKAGVWNEEMGMDSRDFSGVRINRTNTFCIQET